MNRDELERLARRIVGGDLEAARKALAILEEPRLSPLHRPLTRSEALRAAAEDGRARVLVEVGQEGLDSPMGFRNNVLRAAFEGWEEAFDLRCRVLAVRGDALVVEADAGILADTDEGDDSDEGGFRVTGSVVVGFTQVVDAASEDEAVRSVMNMAAEDLDLDWSDDASVEVDGVTRIDD